jgi:predicted Rossmann fold flavoprotein
VKPVLIVGAGAAGLMAAIFAAGRGLRVIVIETTDEGGRKILISGGGRCNVLPRALEPDRFVSDSPRPFVRRLLRSWPIDQQRAFFERDLDLPLVLDAETGKYFPVSNRARDVRDRLVTQAGRNGAEFRFNTRLTDLARHDGGWIASATTGSIEAGEVILATGGRSVPTTGSDGAGFELATRLGHRVHPIYPALTPLVCDPAPHAVLAGVSLSVRLRARWRGRTRETHGGFLFTHHGYSGPAVLDISDVAVRSRMEGSERAVIRARWSELDAPAWERELRGGDGLVAKIVARQLPARLGELLLAESGVPAGRRAADLTRSERASLVERLASYELPWTSDEGYKKAEVTGGGVALDEVDHRTLESRRVPGLYFCGEILDAFGPIGGHNFAWAWSTGRAAGLHVVQGPGSRVQSSGTEAAQQ